MHRKVIVLAAILLACPSCTVPKDTHQAAPDAAATVAAQAALSVTPRVLDEHRVELAITTSMPLPVKVATSIDLAGQKSDDTYIGYQGDFLTLHQPTTRVVLDTSKAGHPLPAASYVASVDFFPTWGAEGNAEAAKMPEAHASQVFALGGSGRTRGSAIKLAERQKWVIANVTPNDPWDRRRFERELGPAQRSRSDLSPLHDAYYFAGADMTLIVNRVRREVSVWRIGRATK